MTDIENQMLQEAVAEASRIVGEQAADNFALHVSHQAASVELWSTWLDGVLEAIAAHVATQLAGWGVTGEQEVLVAQIIASESFFARFKQLWNAPGMPAGGVS